MKSVRTILRFLKGSQKEEKLGKKITRNAFWLTAGDVANRLIKAILIVFTTRILPVTEYGAFSFTLNLVALTFIVSDFGIASVLQRKLAQGEDKKYLGTSFVMKLGLLAIATLITIVAAGVSDARVMPLALALILMTSFDVLKNFFLVIHSAQNRMEKLAFANTLETAVTVAVGLLILFISPSAAALAWAYTAGAFLSLLYAIKTVRRDIAGIFSFLDKKLARSIFIAGWPLALGGMTWGLMNTTDSLILGWIKGLNIVAFYNAAAKIPQFLGPIGGIVLGATFPSLVATMKNPETHKRLFQRTNELLFSITIPIAAGGILTAGPLIQKLYGENYQPSAFISGFLLLNFVQTAASFFLMQFIFVHNHQKKSLIYISAAWALNVVLSITLIPFLGMLGAALASLVSQSAVFLSHTHFVKKHYNLSVLGNELLKPLVAAAVMVLGLLIANASHQTIFFSIPFGGALYGIALFLLKPKIFYELRDTFRVTAYQPQRETDNF